MAASRPTLADVARAADVSVPTVSKAISGRSDVAEGTRQRVLEAMRELGYHARVGLGGNERHGIIELLIGGVGTLWAIEIVRGAEEAAARYGRSLVVTSSLRETFTVDGWVDAALAHKASGVIIATSRVTGGFERLTAARVPIVRLDSAGSGGSDEAEVGATNWAGMRDATRHLLDLGHRRIGFIGGEAQVQVSQDRLEGYSAALRRAGIAVDPELVCEGDFMIRSGEDSGRRLLDLADPPTAIVASSDLEAMGVYHAAHERGLRVPEDLSVIGFDDTVLCGYLSPPLTSVRQPLAQMADQAVRLLSDMAREDASAHPRIELSTELIERGSTTAPPQR
ncbi:LacI family DNA-binding transcriptional regulator [Microbacterium karelineae]|uniref:LacI family DNA-binding transcriptional regulator n=1 Tax=Microbacterium karelineae TaxID=2654283 RepID=UPI0012EAC13E|nr:LacI family DNA-binding transcriptional regulator [Microbacterium karelineae]